LGRCVTSIPSRNVEAIRRLFRIGHNRAVAIELQLSIFSGCTAPVVRNAVDEERELVNTSWGLVFSTYGADAFRDELCNVENESRVDADAKLFKFAQHGTSE
jgi:hypothetical protein